MTPPTIRPWLVLAWLLAFAPLLGGLPATAAAAVPAVPSPAEFSWARFLAPFHIVVLHFPIGFLSLAVLLELRAWRRPESSLRSALQYVLLLTVLAVVTTIALGFFRALDGGYEPGLISRHRNWGLVAAILLVCTWQLHGFMIRQVQPGGTLAGFRLMLVLSLGAMSIAGHHGGSLTHGSTFLTENAPEPLRHLLAEAPAGSEIPAQSTSAATGLPAPLAELLHGKCVSCHGAEKKKGGFRIDVPADLLAGGKSGRPGVVPGDPGRSEVLRVVLLARSHEEAMPPDGKDPLTADEVAILVRWIQQGAPGLPAPTPP